MSEVCLDLRVELCLEARLAAARTRQREGAAVDPSEAQRPAHTIEGIEGDAAVGGELSPRDAQHPARAEGEDGLPPSGGRPAVAERQDAEPRIRRPHRPCSEEAGRQSLPGLREDLGHVLRLDGHGCRVAVEVGVGRSEQQQPVPRDGKRDPDVVLGDGERRAPVAPARDEHVHALAEPHRRAGTRILETADDVHPRPGGVHRDARPHVDDVPVDLDLRAPDIPVDQPK